MKSIKISCTSLYFGSDVSKWPIIITPHLYYAFILKVPKLGQLTLPRSCITNAILQRSEFSEPHTVSRNAGDRFWIWPPRLNYRT